MGMRYKRGGIWYYGVKVNGQWVRRSSRSSSAQVAIRLQDEDRLKVAAGMPLDGEATPEGTFAEFATRYLEWKQGNGRDTDREEDAVAHFTPLFGGKPLPAVSRQDVDEYITARRQKVKPGTVQRELGILKAMLNQAIRWELIAKNPAALLTVTGSNQPRERLLSEEEITSLLDVAAPLLRDLLEAALLTGMRRGELLALEERDCNFLREQIRIRHSKTGHARTIPMHPRVKEILWTRCLGNERRQVFPLVNVQRPFAQALKDAKLQDVRFHDLRHCAASYLFMTGADPRTVMQVLGHRDPRMTLRVYAMVSTEHMREAIHRLNWNMSGTSRGKNTSIPSTVTSENV